MSAGVPVKRIYRGELGQVNFEPTNRVFRTLVPVVHRLARLLTKTPTWHGGENLPATGPVIIVPNHISSLDPVMVGEFLATFKEFPPAQKAASFSIDQVMEKIESAAAGQA